MIDDEQFAYFNRQLSGLIRSGVPLEKSLRDLACSSKGKLQGLLLGMEQKLSQGMKFEEVLQQNRDELPPLYVDLCSAGAASGDLPAVLENFSSYAIEQKGFRDKLGLMSLYPGIVLLFAVVMAAVLTALPYTVNKSLSDSHLLPSFNFEKVLDDPVFLTLNGAALIVFAVLGVGLRNPLLRAHMFLWKFPPTRYLKLTVLSSMFQYLTASGVPHSRTPGIISRFLKDPVLKSFLDAVQENMENGMSFSESLGAADSRIIPETWIWMASTGEQSGRLSENFSSLADYYHDKAEMQIRLWLGAVLPALTLVAGVFVFLNIMLVIHKFIPLIEEVISI